MIKFDKNELLEPMIYSTNDEYETRCRARKEIVEDIKNLYQRIDKAIIKIDTISVDDLDNIKLMEQKLNNIKSILQGEKVEE